MTDCFVRQAELVPQSLLAELMVTVIGLGTVGRQAAWQLAAIGVEDMLFKFEYHLPHRILSQETIKFAS